MDNIGLFDLDGSLADYELSLREHLQLIASPGEGDFDDLWDESKPWLKARIKMIKSLPNWWRNLHPISNGMAIYTIAREMGFDCQVLTKGPKGLPTAWKEKVEWCQEWLHDGVDIHIVSDKKVVYGKFLYDDYPDYMLRWLKHRPRGLGIMPVTPQNQDFQHPNVIKWDGNNLDQIMNALNVVMNRQFGEPLTIPVK